MLFYADVHIHSHYSRATSKDLDLEHLFYWAQLKGINVVGTGDCVHPKWLQELKDKLEPAEPGFFRLKKKIADPIQKTIPASCVTDVRFMLTVEISNIYKRIDRVRKIHNLLYFPHFAAVDKVQKKLETIGNIRSDGRPILGLDSRDLLAITLDSDPKSYLVPAHIWTPWFSALGSKGGFDRMEDCFADLTKHIFAVETGLSSDPIMNWRLKQLDPYILVSNSDAHSPGKLAREATVYDTEFSYDGIYNALSDPSDKGLKETVEFFPEEGKYHYDGHRDCKMRLHPQETIKNKGLCPVCKKPVTIGVMARVEELADRPDGEKGKRWRPYVNIIPLPELIAQVRGTGSNTKGVQALYQQMLNALGSEMHILRHASLTSIESCCGELIAQAVERMRAGKIEIAAGYDGEFGEIHLFSDKDRVMSEGQLSLFKS